MIVSIIIPVFNTKYEDLLKCLDSILAQTFPNFEVIIIDDGSEDYYGNRLDELVQLDSRISVFHKKNEGVSVARNFGVNKATGQYILFVDGDDILTPWLLESAVQAVEDYDCDVIVGMINTTDKRPSIFPSREKNVKFELLDDHKKKELECHIFSKSCERWRPDQDGWEFNGEGCWAHFLKKEIALENQFIPGVAVGEDTIWALTMLNSSKDYRIGMLYEKWYYYIQNDYSVLNKYNPKIVGQLTLPVDILEKKYGASTGIVHAAYTDWLLMKLSPSWMRWLTRWSTPAPLTPTLIISWAPSSTVRCASRRSCSTSRTSRAMLPSTTRTVRRSGPESSSTSGSSSARMRMEMTCRKLSSAVNIAVNGNRGMSRIIRSMMLRIACCILSTRSWQMQRIK